MCDHSVKPSATLLHPSIIHQKLSFSSFKPTYYYMIPNIEFSALRCRRKTKSQNKTGTEEVNRAARN